MIISEIGMFVSGKSRFKLTPEPTHNWICTDNKENFSDSVYLSENSFYDNWRDATDEEYQEWVRKQDEPPEEEATAEDYQQALERLGVEV